MALCGLVISVRDLIVQVSELEMPFTDRRSISGGGLTPVLQAAMKQDPKLVGT